MAWRFPPKPVQDTTYDLAHPVGLLLRFPVGAASGGELLVQRYAAGQPLGPPVHLALEPGEPDGLPQAFWDWVLARLQARGLVPAGAQTTAAPTAEPVPAPSAPPLRLG